jgi:hypothetical protein
MPEQAVPFATSTGWAVRSVEGGSAGELCYLDGMLVPFASNERERETARDPRPSLGERYKDKAEYLEKVRAAALELQGRGFVLEEDVERIVTRVEKRVRFETAN